MSDAENTSKQRGRPFQKGGGDPRINRGGRPKGYNAFRKGFRNRKRDDTMRDELWRIATEAPENKDRLNAMKLMWEYGYGKTPAAPEDNDALRESGNRLPADMTRSEIIAIARGDKPE